MPLSRMATKAKLKDPIPTRVSLKKVLVYTEKFIEATKPIASTIPQKSHHEPS